MPIEQRAGPVSGRSLRRGQCGGPRDRDDAAVGGRVTGAIRPKDFEIQTSPKGTSRAFDGAKGISRQE